MSRVLVLLSFPACVLFAVVFGGEEAHACKCAPSTPEERLQRSSAVFLGVVAEVEEDSSGDARSRRATFEVEVSWKGISEEQVTVQGDGSICDIPFQEGKRYLVYATGGGGQGGKTSAFRTSRCQATRLLEEPLAVNDLEVLGSPEWTRDTSNVEETREDSGSGTEKLPSSGGYSLLVLGAGALLVVGGIALKRYAQS